MTQPWRGVGLWCVLRSLRVVVEGAPSCAEVLIQLTEDDGFQFVNNSTVLYGDALHDVVGMLGGSPVICINFSSNGTVLVKETDIFYSYPTAYFVLTYIGCSLSLISVTIILLSLALFKELRTPFCHFG